MEEMASSTDEAMDCDSTAPPGSPARNGSATPQSPMTPHQYNTPQSIPSTPSTPCGPMLFDPKLPEGWKRIVNQRKLGSSAGSYDVYLIHPNGKRFRSRPDMQRWFDKMEITDMVSEDFDFSACGLENQKVKTPKPKTPKPKTPKPNTPKPENKRNSLTVKLTVKVNNTDSPSQKKDTKKDTQKKDTPNNKLTPSSSTSSFVNDGSILIVKMGFSTPRQKRKLSGGLNEGSENKKMKYEKRPSNIKAVSQKNKSKKSPKKDVKSPKFNSPGPMNTSSISQGQSSILEFISPEAQIKRPFQLIESSDLPNGWTRHVQQRPSKEGHAAKWRVEIRSPEGRRFKWRAQLESYLDENGISEYTINDFDFSRKLHVQDTYNSPVKHNGIASSSSTSPVKTPVKMQIDAECTSCAVCALDFPDNEELRKHNAEEHGITSANMASTNMTSPNKQQDAECVSKPSELPEGWTRKIEERHDRAGQYRIFLISPEGRSFRSKGELENHLDCKGLSSKYDMDVFDFSQKAAGIPKKPRIKQSPVSSPSKGPVKVESKSPKCIKSPLQLIKSDIEKSDSPKKPTNKTFKAADSSDLPEGWTRVVQHSTDADTEEKIHVVIVSPEGRKFYNRTKLIKYIEDKAITSFTIEDFDFSKKAAGIPRKSITKNTVRLSVSSENECSEQESDQEVQFAPKHLKSVKTLTKSQSPNIVKSASPKLPGKTKTSEAVDSSDLPEGWRRVIQQPTDAEANAKSYICIISPEGKKFFNKTQLEKHIEDKSITSYDIKDFDFSKKAAGIPRKSYTKSAEKPSKPANKSVNASVSSPISLTLPASGSPDRIVINYSGPSMSPNDIKNLMSSISFSSPLSENKTNSSPKKQRSSSVGAGGDGWSQCNGNSPTKSPKNCSPSKTPSKSPANGSTIKSPKSCTPKSQNKHRSKSLESPSSRTIPIC